MISALELHYILRSYQAKPKKGSTGLVRAFLSS